MKTYNSLKSKKGDMLYSPLFLIVIESDYLCKESQARSPSGKKDKKEPQKAQLGKEVSIPAVKSLGVNNIHSVKQDPFLKWSRSGSS